MTKAELLRLARLRLDDGVEEYLWSTTELTLYIDQAVAEAQIRARNVTDSTTDACTLIQLKAGVAFYPTHPAVFFIDRVYDTGQNKRLLKFGIDEADWCMKQWQVTTGQPLYYSEEMNHYGADGRKMRGLSVSPIPDADGQLRLTVFRTQLCPLDDNCEPELPSHQHPDLIHWVAHLAYQKPDADTYNASKALACEAQFTAAFGEKQSARLLEYRRKHRPMRVVGQYL